MISSPSDKLTSCKDLLAEVVYILIDLGSLLHPSWVSRKRIPFSDKLEYTANLLGKKEEFKKQIAEGNLLEHAEFVGNMYGTPKDKVEEKLSNGHEVVLEIEVNGAMQVREKMEDAVFIFIAPPSYDALEKRLVDRGTERNEVIKERLEKAHREINLAHNYDYIVINDEVDNAADRIMAIIRAEHAKCDRTLSEYLKLMEETNND